MMWMLLYVLVNKLNHCSLDAFNYGKVANHTSFSDRPKTSCGYFLSRFIQLAEFINEPFIVNFFCKKTARISAVEGAVTM
jgi:hypothetical protein